MTSSDTNTPIGTAAVTAAHGRPRAVGRAADQRSFGASRAPDTADQSVRDRLPLSSLLVFALLGFLLISTETMPAGILPQIAAGMSVSEGMVGQFVTAYALGTVLVTIPAIVLTRGFRRKPLFLVGIAGFLLTNTAVALSPYVASPWWHGSSPADCPGCCGGCSLDTR